MLLRSLFILSFTALIGIINPVSAASSEDMLKVANMVTDDSVTALLRRKEFFNSHYIGDTAVFVCNDMRYSVHYYKTLESTSLWLWVRTNGTHELAVLDTIYDEDLDGVINFGAEGGNLNKSGVEFQTYWQQRLDQTVNALIKCKS